MSDAGRPPMPAFQKAPAELGERFRMTLAEYPQAPTRMTFGSPCAYVNGNMAVGLHRSGWFVRLDRQGTDALVAAGGLPFSPMAGRPMTGYTLLPPSVLADPAQLRQWIEQSLQFVGKLPAKAERSRELRT